MDAAGLEASELAETAARVHTARLAMQVLRSPSSSPRRQRAEHVPAFAGRARMRDLAARGELELGLGASVHIDVSRPVRQ